MYEYLNDSEFLLKMDRLKRREVFARLTILDFAENPIKNIEGTISSGSITVNGNSSVRRTISLTMITTLEPQDIEDVSNLISINKKIKIEVGLTNPFKKYQNYGKIIWFPQGIYILSNANISNSTSGSSISISGKDKMVLLNGSVGGTLPASVSFHELYNIDDDDNVTITYPTIGRIIREAVFHYGLEQENNIYINDIDETAKLLIKYSGSSPIWFTTDYSAFVISDSPPAATGWISFESGADVGYKETDFTYPGELILNAGDSVVSLLDKIVSTLGGNYEYFYDVYGRFIFQEKRNYQNNSYTPIVDLEGETYIRNLTENQYTYAFRDSETTISIAKNPNYDNIKNDFICWGTKDVGNNTTVSIRYHLAIDEKPILDKCLQDMYLVKSGGTPVRYEFVTAGKSVSRTWEKVCSACKPSAADWREELYREALVNNFYSLYPTQEIQDGAAKTKGRYDEELIAEWRNLYDPDNEEWQTNSERLYWNPIVYQDPQSLTYWLDFIDEGTEISKYSINEIGLRSIVTNDSNIQLIYNNDIPDIIFLENTTEGRKKKKELESTGQQTCLYKSEQEDYFLTSSTGASAYDSIRDSLYQHLTYNTSISISCLPIYYLEPNNLIYIQDSSTGTRGNYVVTQFTIPLAYNGTMSVTAEESLIRI
jgi:hypothetical protein